MEVQASGMRPQRIEPGPGQESVWDYPRPPRVEPSSDAIVVRVGDQVVAETARSQRVLETSQPPAFYIPEADIDMDALTPALGRSFCEWKGEASYFDLATDSASIDQVAWTYPDPTARFESIIGHLAFYAQKLTCSVNGEEVIANEGSFYGGWITSSVVGPFKGGLGTGFW